MTTDQTLPGRDDATRTLPRDLEQERRDSVAAMKVAGGGVSAEMHRKQAEPGGADD